MSGPFRIGIVGCGRIAIRHAEACLRASGVELAVVVDPVEERATELAKRIGVEPVIRRSCGEALADMDAAVIAAPNHLHRTLAVECLDAGVPVLIEKPLAVSVSEGEEIVAAAEGNGVAAAVGYVTRFRRSVQLMRTLLDAEYFGTLQRFAYQFGGRGGWSPYSAYNLDRAAMGGGVLVGTGSHFLDRLLYWFGSPVEVCLEDDSHGGPEANAHATFVFGSSPKRLRGLALFSRTVALPAKFIMETDKGTVELDDRDDAQIRFRPNAEPRVELMIGEPTAAGTSGQPDDVFRLQLEDFVSACQTHRAPLVSAGDALATDKLISRLYANRRQLGDGGHQGMTDRDTTEILETTGSGVR